MWPTKPNKVLSGFSQKRLADPQINPLSLLWCKYRGWDSRPEAIWLMRCRKNIVIFNYSKQILETTLIHIIPLIANIFLFWRERQAVYMEQNFVKKKNVAFNSN